VMSVSGTMISVPRTLAAEPSRIGSVGVSPMLVPSRMSRPRQMMYKVHLELMRREMGDQNMTDLSSAPTAIALGVALTVAPSLALAETQVRGKPDAVSVEAQNSSIEEILVALSNSYNVRFRSLANVEKRVTGTYQGSLQQVMTQILRGYDFFIKSGENGLEITLLGFGKTFAVTAAGSAQGLVLAPALSAAPSLGSAAAIDGLVLGPALSAAPSQLSAAPGSALTGVSVNLPGSRTVPPPPISGTTPPLPAAAPPR